ncbi:FAD-dependent monooxygenase [Pseudonocardia acaciae]|uniref:FAD-dependent monooxygenase n=1 Tax=Pseudonocardia acaciae TaxID=551276 RepID=UPI000491EB59|nr:FAD-dependent monooxygenase [Pseudonocardia acaciae]
MSAPVLVVGAGPTGLAMAVELARRGVAVRVVDAAEAPTSETRALGVQPRTLELFERLGLAGAAVADGVPVTEFRLFSEGVQFLDMSLRGLDTPHPYLLMLPQPRVERLLAARLAELGVRVQRPVELTGFTQRPDEVEVELRHGDGAVERARVSWLVGCDGAHSAVRRRLGVPFLGRPFEENFAVADARMDWSLPHDVFHSFLNRGRFVAYFPMPGGLHRITIAYRPGSAPTGEVTLDELQAAVDRCAPAGARVGDIREAGRFRIHQRKVARHSVGRVFLAGDAAHVHSVVGGQGMNTGIQDAFNLGWKLAAVANGRAGAGLLDSYASERSPVAHRLVRGTRRATRLTLLRAPVATAARRHLAPRITARPFVRRTLSRALTQLDVSYRDGTGGSDGRRLAVGDRFPEIGPQHPDRFTLLVFGAEPPGLRAVLGDRTDLFDIRPVTVPRAGARIGIAGDGLVLVRPDGYLALLGGGLDDLAAYLTKTFAR